MARIQLEELQESSALFYKTRASFSCTKILLKVWILAWLNVDIESLLMHIRSQTSVTQIYAHNSQSDSVKLFQSSQAKKPPSLTTEKDLHEFKSELLNIFISIPSLACMLRLLFLYSNFPTIFHLRSLLFLLYI